MLKPSAAQNNIAAKCFASFGSLPLQLIIHKEIFRMCFTAPVRWSVFTELRRGNKGGSDEERRKSARRTWPGRPPPEETGKALLDCMRAAPSVKYFVPARLVECSAARRREGHERKEREGFMDWVSTYQPTPPTTFYFHDAGVKW